MQGNQMASTSSDGMARFIPIAAKTEQVHEPVLARKYEGPDFITTIKAMRGKLFELQNASDTDEPTTDQGIIKRWKNSNKLLYGAVNDLRRYEFISTLSNQNYSTVLDIAANAHRCTRSGKITQYTFKSLKKSMTDEEVHVVLKKILEGDYQTVASLNKAKRGGVEEATKETEGSEEEDQQEDVTKATASNENWRTQFQMEQQRNGELSKEIEEIRTRLTVSEAEKVKAQKERDNFKRKCQELLTRIKERELVIDEMKLREHEDRSRMSQQISYLREELNSTKKRMAEIEFKDVDEELASAQHEQKKRKKLDTPEGQSEVRRKTQTTEKTTGPFIEKRTEVKTTSGRVLTLTESYEAATLQEEGVASSSIEINPGEAEISTPEENHGMDDFSVADAVTLERDEISSSSVEFDQDEKVITIPKEIYDIKDSNVLAASIHQQKELEEDPVPIDASTPVKEVKETWNSKELLPTIGEFVAVAYSNCDTFYIGKVMRVEERLLISFLEAAGKKRKTFRWPSQERVEPADPEQVFMRGLEAVTDDRNLCFPQLDEVKMNFQDCREKLLEKQHREQVDNIWNDLEIPYDVFESGVTWKDIKTLQLEMPDVHESFMLSLFGPGVTWKRGWLNDEIINAYMNYLEKKANRNGKKVITATSFFYNMVQSPVQRQTGWRKKTNLSQYKVFLFPGQFGQLNHWVLGVVDLKNSTIAEVDPAGGKHPKFVRVIRNYLENRPGLEGRTWREVEISHPLQKDDVSCGVYVLKIAECIIEDKELAFDQSDVDNYRYKVAARLLNL